MTVLFIDRKGLTLRADGAALVLYDGDERVATVPLRILERVCIRGNVLLSAAVLGKLGEQGVGVLVLGGRKREPVLMMPSLRVDVKRRAAQFALAQDTAFCLKMARLWGAAKVGRQLALLEKFAAENESRRARLHNMIETLRTVAAQTERAADIGALRGLEGAAAAHYFAALAVVLPPSLGFSGRNRRPPKDAFNVVLSLGYTMLHFELVRQIYLVGLDPFLGFYHTAAHGRESLASDLLEPVRPLYDEWAAGLFAGGVLRPEDFLMRGEVCEMGKAGRMRFYPAYERAAKEWRPLLYSLCVGLLRDLGYAAEGNEAVLVPSEIYRVADAVADCV